MNAKIYRLAAGCAVLAAISLVAPRFVRSSEGGFAAAATAILVFLGVLATAFVVSLHLLVLTIRHFRALSTGARVAGVAPAVVLGVGLTVLIGLLRY
jgi:hypothetical protein